jgi:ABC-2 type transport system ATP-binding protein
MYALELKDVNYKRKNFELKNVSFTVPKGMITGLVGRNGAGKTTLIHIIANNINRDSGTILYNGIRYWEDEAGIKRKLGMVYDCTNFNEQFKPARFKKKIAPCIDGFDMAYFDRYMEKFELPYKTRVAKYSTGMKQKFMLLLTLSCRPEILIMDEPTSGVDPADRYEILDMLQEFVEDEKHSVLFSTHITSDLDKIADYLVLMEKGEIVMEGEKDALLEKYRIMEFPTPLVTLEIKNQLIGVKKGAFGITGLTDNPGIWSMEGANAKIPIVEDLAIYLRELSKGEEY